MLHARLPTKQSYILFPIIGLMLVFAARSIGEGGLACPGAFAMAAIFGLMAVWPWRYQFRITVHGDALTSRQFSRAGHHVRKVALSEVASIEIEHKRLRHRDATGKQSFRKYRVADATHVSAVMKDTSQKDVHLVAYLVGQDALAAYVVAVLSERIPVAKNDSSEAG